MCVRGTVGGLADIKEWCLISPFYSGQRFCSYFQWWEASLLANGHCGAFLY